ncbi:MAG: HAMP domain-containing histidine kinase [Planctomycetes bacterium]|nr:HAMP domain-containing histidine kinase [Planctomycetota bacterium]
MRQGTPRRRMRIGLQVKCAVILTMVVLGAMATGGWFYFDTARKSLRRSEMQHAMQLTNALGLAAQYDLRQGRDLALRRLAEDFLANEGVRYAALVDADGLPAATACATPAGRQRWAHLADVPVTVSLVRRMDDDLLVLAKPIVMRDVIWYRQRLVGGVRVVFDTSGTTARLAAVRARMMLVAGAVIALAIPLGYVLVWRVVLRPLRRLLALTDRLARGDFHARLKLRSRDEIGQLGEAFDAMAGRLADMRDELLRANEQLEQQVARRTEELQFANARLRAEMAEKEEFLRAVSHDLNAPLRNIAGMATMIAMRWRDELPEDIMARLQRIQANVDIETAMIKELLELSRIRTRPQRREVVDCSTLVRGVVESFDYELRARRIDIDLHGEMPLLYVEKNRLREVFQNLIDNAIKYMHRRTGGWIRVGYRRTRRMHEFYVADNGPGIAPDQHERVFCVFRRAETARAAAVEGKGVGLALVRSVASNYDGRAWVESQPGRGSTFYVALSVENTSPPIENTDPPRAPAENDAAEPQPTRVADRTGR